MEWLEPEARTTWNGCFVAHAYIVSTSFSGANGRQLCAVQACRLPGGGYVVKTGVGEGQTAAHQSRSPSGENWEVGF